MVIAAVAMFDSRAGALPDPTGVAPGGIGAGWYPFWAGAVILGSAAVVAWRSLVTPQAAGGAFAHRGQVVDLFRFVVPMVLATWLMSERLLGFYAASGLYIAYYAGVVARYRWYVALAAGVVLPVVIYLAFEVGFSVFFPKSFLYPRVPF